MGDLDSFLEANQLLSNTLKQLDEAMKQSDRQWITPLQSSRHRSVSPIPRYKTNMVMTTPADDILNGNVQTQIENFERNNNQERPTSDPSSTTWENKDTNSIGSGNTSSNEESPISDQGSTGSGRITLEKLCKAIDADKIAPPDRKVRYKILKWVYDNNGDEALRDLVVCLH
ncbi:unnamed protein product [Bursaphelenchus xylophilus]|uniref:(pine wood nematode) hypothetical protein n=1 Tax=Bursaphelenchus xylophilus TaxID=6326 RepID=A0A811L7Y5_BURXY|nr:unnamed protein product [Bursaphelenchus xylophilus]CAG9111984.1 unnamed protein product [Bursaphelenchus xylophilus]